MKKKFLTIISILIVIILAACGSAEPTVSPEDLASTAMADAWIAITQTQAALPTATSLPPTFTPEPTFTLQPVLPTLPPTVAPLATVAGPTADACNQIPVEKPLGTLTTVEIRNQSQGQVNLSFGMNKPNDKGECFTYSFSLGKGDALSAKVLTGWYWAWAWINAAEPSNASNDSLLLTDPNVTYHIVITKETVNFK